MKKIMKAVVALLAISVVAFSLVGCFGDGKGEYIPVEIVHGTKTETVEFYSKSSASHLKVNPDYIENKVLLGYYDTEDDSGKMYFDFLGKACVNYWVSSFPSKLYAVYENLDTSTVFKSAALQDENPKGLYYRSDESYWKFSFLSFSIKAIESAKSDDEFTVRYADTARFIHSNPDKQIKLTMFVTAKLHRSDDSGSLKFRLKIGSEPLDVVTKTMSTSWSTFSVSTTLYAKQLKGDSSTTNYIMLQINSSPLWDTGDDFSVKNIYYTISIVQ